MKVLPSGWHIHQPKPDRACPPKPGGRRRNPEKELRKLRSRFGAISRRFQRAVSFRRLRGMAKTAELAALLLVAAIGVPFALMKVLSPWPVMTTIKHLASAPNCDAARFVDLAPARKGQPGYWRDHDADNDGWACGPLP